MPHTSNGVSNGVSNGFALHDTRTDLMGLPLKPNHAQDYKYEKFLKFSNPSGKIEKFGIALFGLGRAGSIHLSNCLGNPRVEVLYIVEKVAERREQMQNCLNLHNIKFLSIEDEDVVFNDPAVKGVIIATSTHAHEEIVIKALNNKKAVFCEKPIANTIQEVEECFRTAEKHGLPLLCAFNRRFDPTFLEIKGRVKSGELGPLHVIKTCSRDAPLPSLEYLRTSKGLIKDMAVHDLDVICWIADEFPCKVYAAGTAHRQDIADLPDYDTVSINLTFPSGCMAMVDLSRYAVYGYDQRLEVFGPGGMLIAPNLSTTSVEAYKRENTELAPILFSFPSRYEEGYRNELNHFLDVSEGKAELSITPEQISRVFKVMQACEVSLKTGQAVDISYD